MAHNPPQKENNEQEITVWGDGKVVSCWGEEGEWIMYDPDCDVVDVSDWA